MILNNDNFLLYAMHHYQVPTCPTLDEFQNDLKIIKYIKKNLAKPELNTRLLLNHIIVLFNCFGDAALHLLFFKVEKEHWGTLATFLIYISRMPSKIPEYGVDISTLTLNQTVIDELRKI
jgi:hypothetical protein